VACTRQFASRLDLARLACDHLPLVVDLDLTRK